MWSKSQTGINLLFYHREINALFTMIKFSWRTSTTFLAKRNERYFLLRLFTYTLKWLILRQLQAASRVLLEGLGGGPKINLSRGLFFHQIHKGWYVILPFWVCQVPSIVTSFSTDIEPSFSWSDTFITRFEEQYYFSCVRLRKELEISYYYSVISFFGLLKAVDFKKIVELISKSKHVFVCVGIKKPERSCGRSQGRN